MMHHMTAQSHVFRMPNDRLPKKLLSGEIKGLRPPDRCRSGFDDHSRRCVRVTVKVVEFGRLYRDAQARLLWKRQTCPARIELESATIGIGAE